MVHIEVYESKSKYLRDFACFEALKNDKHSWQKPRVHLKFILIHFCDRMMQCVDQHHLVFQSFAILVSNSGGSKACCKTSSRTCTGIISMLLLMLLGTSAWTSLQFRFGTRTRCMPAQTRLIETFVDYSLRLHPALDSSADTVKEVDNSMVDDASSKFVNCIRTMALTCA